MFDATSNLAPSKIGSNPARANRTERLSTSCANAPPLQLADLRPVQERVALGAAKFHAADPALPDSRFTPTMTPLATSTAVTKLCSTNLIPSGAARFTTEAHRPRQGPCRLNRSSPL